MRRSLNILVQFVWRGGGVPVGIFKCDSRKEKYLGSVFSGWNKCLCISLYLLSCISDAFSLMFTADFFWFIKCLYIYTVPSPSVTNIYHTIIFYKLTLWNYKYNVLYGSIPISKHKHSMVYLYFCLYMYLFYVEFSTYMYNCYLYLNRGW